MKLFVRLMYANENVKNKNLSGKSESIVLLFNKILFHNFSFHTANID
jgi:hypothetical protein